MPPPPPPAPAHIRFGFDNKSIHQARSLGVPVSYGSTWAGSWNQKWGWGGIESELQQARSAGVTAVIPWLYWSDDISPACVENGCTDRYQGVWKDKATWRRLAIEPEFNKGGIENYEAFDGYLAEQAAIFHQRGLQVAIGFGNWGRSHWARFDRAVAASDILGTIALQSSVRDPGTRRSSGACRS